MKKKSDRKVVVSVKLPNKMIAGVRVKAKKWGLLQSEVIRMAIESFLERY